MLKYEPIKHKSLKSIITRHNVFFRGREKNMFYPWGESCMFYLAALLVLVIWNSLIYSGSGVLLSTYHPGAKLDEINSSSVGLRWWLRSQREKRCSLVWCVHHITRKVNTPEIFFWIYLPHCKAKGTLNQHQTICGESHGFSIWKVAVGFTGTEIYNGNGDILGQFPVQPSISSDLFP